MMIAQNELYFIINIPRRSIFSRYVSLPLPAVFLVFATLNTTWLRVVDSLLAIWIFMILACGIHGMLWQAAVMQHWFKVCGYGQVRQIVREKINVHVNVMESSLNRAFRRQLFNNIP